MAVGTRNVVIAVGLLFTLWGGPFALAQSHDRAKTQLQGLLSIDRLDYYNKALADNLTGKQDPQLVQDLYQLTIDDYLKHNLNANDLNKPENWIELTKKVLATKHPQRAYLASIDQALVWNYNFLKNKLVERFKTKEFADSSFAWGQLNGENETSQRTVPKIKGTKILLDYERYIAEKTSRAIIWDAILNDREFEFHIGTEKDFQESLKRTGLEIVQEVIPMARNYNKIYLAFDPQTQKYRYIINQISGDDRVKHLAAQLRLLTVNGKKYFDQHDKVRVVGSARVIHAQIESSLSQLFQSLPKADKVIIGQKGAIDDAIRSAGLMEVVRTELPELSSKLGLDVSKTSKFEKITQKVDRMGPFLDQVFASGPVDLAEAYGKSSTPFARSYAQFNSEQISHEFSDYLLQDKNGNVQRWRVFSAVWGDEIIPIARALDKSGHRDIVYIGTAGALADKGLKVGDLVAGAKVQTHSGKTLEFSEATLVDDSMRKFTIGQVYTPFDETDRWLKNVRPNIEVVEVETGYLRENISSSARLQAYFLISDVVGSETETLAHAASNSGKRKKAQLRLIEGLFQEAGVVSPIANFEMIRAERAFKNTLAVVQSLRASRDPLSQMQVTHVALRQGAKTPEEIEKILKHQKTFVRDEFSRSLNIIESVLAEVQKSVPKDKRVGLISNELLTGQFNPKMPTQIEILVDGMSEAELARRIGAQRWQSLQTLLPANIKMNLVGDGTDRALLADREFYKTKGDFINKFTTAVMKPYGFALELDAKGLFRIKEVPGMGSAFRCEALFL